MLAFLVENLGTILVAAILTAVVVLIVLKLRRNKKKNGCIGCDCASCSHTCSYHKQQY